MCACVCEYLSIHRIPIFLKSKNIYSDRHKNMSITFRIIEVSTKIKKAAEGLRGQGSYI